MNVSEKTRQRERKRPQEEIELVELARELTWLSRRYARFGPELLNLRQRVYMQLRSPGKKQAAVIKCFPERETVLDLEEIMEETDLDRFSVSVVLARLEQGGTLETVTRDGKKPRMTLSGRPTDRVYYRLSRARTPARTPPALNPSR